MRAVLLLATMAALASATAITWTGIANDMQWTNHINWYPAQVPGQADDVTINTASQVTLIQVTAPTAVNSVALGVGDSQPCNLTIFQSFIIGAGGMNVQPYSNLIINTGLSQVFGTVTVGGHLNFIDGVLGGAWTVIGRGSANLGNGNAKGFSGCVFISQGTLALGGVIILNQSSTFTLESATSSNVDLIVQGLDGTTVLFDASQASFTYSTGTFLIQAPVLLGKFTLESGNITILDSLAFKSSLNIPSGSYVVALGSAALNMTAGATGAGVLTLSCNSATIGNLQFAGYVNMVGGPVDVASQSSIAVLTIKGGQPTFNAATYAGQLNLISGTTNGASTVVAAQVLVQTQGFTLGNTIEVNDTITFMASTLTFGMTGALTIDASAKAIVQGALQLTGPAFITGVTNNGLIRAQAALTSQNINIQGAGSVHVSSTFVINTATVSQAAIVLASGASFTGAHSFLTLGKVVSATGGNVTATFGEYTLTCHGECDNVSTPSTTTPTSAFSFTA